MQEIAELRTRLKNVNVEYSTLLRQSRAALKPVTLDVLRQERHSLMARIAELRARESAEELRLAAQAAQAQAALMVATRGAGAPLTAMPDREAIHLRRPVPGAGGGAACEAEC